MLLLYAVRIVQRFECCAQTVCSSCSPLCLRSFQTLSSPGNVPIRPYQKGTIICYLQDTAFLRHITSWLTQPAIVSMSEKSSVQRPRHTTRLHCHEHFMSSLPFQPCWLHVSASGVQNLDNAINGHLSSVSRKITCLKVCHLPLTS